MELRKICLPTFCTNTYNFHMHIPFDDKNKYQPIRCIVDKHDKR